MNIFTSSSSVNADHIGENRIRCSNLQFESKHFSVNLILKNTCIFNIVRTHALLSNYPDSDKLIPKFFCFCIYIYKLTSVKFLF